MFDALVQRLETAVSLQLFLGVFPIGYGRISRFGRCSTRVHEPLLLRLWHAALCGMRQLLSFQVGETDEIRQTGEAPTCLGNL